MTFLAFGANLAREQHHILAHSFPVPATVVGLDVETHITNGRGGTAYRPVVRFEYQIAGATRMGDQVDPLRESRGGHWAWRVLDRYEVGQHVTAWVRDDVPDAAFLDRTPSRTPYVMLSFGAAFDLVTALVWWRARRGRR